MATPTDHLPRRGIDTTEEIPEGGIPPASDVSAWTRRDVAETIGAAPQTVREWERAGWCTPQRGGATRPNRYRPVDVATATLVAAARRLGLSGETIAAACEELRRRGVPEHGWRGWALVDDDGATAFARSPAALGDVVENPVARPAALLPVWAPSTADAPAGARRPQ